MSMSIRCYLIKRTHTSGIAVVPIKVYSMIKIVGISLHLRVHAFQVIWVNQRNGIYEIGLEFIWHVRANNSKGITTGVVEPDNFSVSIQLIKKNHINRDERVTDLIGHYQV